MKVHTPLLLPSVVTQPCTEGWSVWLAHVLLKTIYRELAVTEHILPPPQALPFYFTAFLTQNGFSNMASVKTKYNLSLAVHLNNW